MKEQFCEWQVKAKEDNPYTWTCAAHLAEGRYFQCQFGSYAESQRVLYPCMDAKEVKVEVAKYENKEAECNRCRIVMDRVGSTTTTSTYWCPSCGAIQRAEHRNSVLDSLGTTELTFKLPEMTADLPCDNS